MFEREGQLVEFTGEFRKKGRTNPTYFNYSYEEKAKFYAQLRGYGIEMGYKDGWAFIKYMEKFHGEKPPYAWKFHKPMQAGPEVRQFAKASAIAWRNSPRNPRNQMGGG